jgi:Bacterial Ig-like domain (group 2)
VLWASSAPGIATVSNAAGSQGLATAVDVGSTTISATFQGLTGSTILTVNFGFVVISPTAAAGIRLIFTMDPPDPFLLSFLSIMAITEDRTVLEFDIGELGGIEQAILELPLRNIDSGGPPGIIDVFTYSGDGIITADEFFAGTLLFTSFSNNGSGTVSVDVTEAVQASESNFLGFRLSTTTSDRYDLGSIAELPEPTLRITFSSIE